ncbi:MAG: flagellar biosynthetic protein FliR [Thermobacillus sp. ZCTH02-B1]|nr:flagellar biosynthetic protein FliR [Thermobacillus sp. ZCTH02-B1]OUM96967.1 MAG: flagellar biosynthetic protein FliR [Thermobacillus sp. ZCTH02-B1]
MDGFLQGFSVFLLVFCRITSFFVASPLFAIRQVPAPFKIGLGFFVSLIVYLAGGMPRTVPQDATYLLHVIHEVLAGLLLGYLFYLFFEVAHISGAFVDTMMGYGMANIVDPMTGASAPLTGNFKYYLLILVFLAMNGHHYMLAALMDSYEWLPMAGDLYAAIAAGNLTEQLARTFATTFLLGFQLAAPVLVAMFLTDVGLGFLAKTAPQFNVFVVGLQVKILVGLLVMMAALAGFGAFCSYLMSVLFHHLRLLMAAITG